MTTEPVLPYAGTTGWSGTDTSYERAIRLSSTGQIGRNQRKIIGYMRERGSLGVTWKDLSGKFGWHHGSASSHLTVLHKSGAIMRLMNRRERCRIYVLPEYRDGREFDEPSNNMSKQQVFDMLVELHKYGEKFDDLVLVGYCELKLDEYWPDWRDK